MSKQYKVCIDAGHGGSDPGAVNGTKYEKVAALQIAKKVGEKLKAKGVAVKYTRSSDKYVTLADRCKISNNYGADAFISIHLNAATNKDANGIECLRYPKVGARTKALASNIQTELIAATGWRDRGVKERSDLYILKRTVASACLVECGFISNLEESKKLFADKWQEKIATAIVKAVEKTMSDS